MIEIGSMEIKNYVLLMFLIVLCIRYRRVIRKEGRSFEACIIPHQVLPPNILDINFKVAAHPIR
jgi:hypothetical protein